MIKQNAKFQDELRGWLRLNEQLISNTLDHLVIIVASPINGYVKNC